MGDKRRNAEALYPAGEKQADKIATLGGHKLADLTLENVLSGKLTAQDIGILPASLQLQGEVARAVDRSCLAVNFDRGAELVNVPQEEIFETYEMLRPGRAQSKDVLLTLAERYRTHHKAANIARLIEDAAEVYERRGLFRKRF